MIDTLNQELMQLWADPHARHALLAHAPYVLGALGILPVLGIILSGFRSPTLKIFTLVWFILAAAGAYFAEESGRLAAESLLSQEPPLSEVEGAALSRHHTLGANTWIWLAVPAFLVIFTLPRNQRIHIPAGMLAFIAALFVGGWIALVGHSGDRLVRVYGLGTPARGAPASGFEQDAAPPPAPVTAPGEPPPGHPTQPADVTPPPSEPPSGPMGPEPPPAGGGT